MKAKEQVASKVEAEVPERKSALRNAKAPQVSKGLVTPVKGNRGLESETRSSPAEPPGGSTPSDLEKLEKDKAIAKAKGVSLEAHLQQVSEQAVEDHMRKILEEQDQSTSSEDSGSEEADESEKMTDDEEASEDPAEKEVEEDESNEDTSLSESTSESTSEEEEEDSKAKEEQKGSDKVQNKLAQGAALVEEKGKIQKANSISSI